MKKKDCKFTDVSATQFQDQILPVIWYLDGAKRKNMRRWKCRIRTRRNFRVVSSDIERGWRDGGWRLP